MIDSAEGARGYSRLSLEWLTVLRGKGIQQVVA
jgi:hypothetical protein